MIWRVDNGRRFGVARSAFAALLLLLSSLASASNVGDIAPDFSRTDLAGKPMQLHALRGKVVLLNFWASWCPPCLHEMPIFSKWQRQYHDKGLRIVGVSMDDGVAPVKALLGKRPVTYPIVMGDAQLGERFGGVLGLPMTFLIDRNGRVLARYRGETNLTELQEKIEVALSAANR